VNYFEFSTRVENFPEVKMSGYLKILKNPSQALILGAQSGYLEIVRAFFPSAANEEALHLAILGNYIEIVQFFLENGIQPDPRDFVTAASLGYLEMVQLFYRPEPVTLTFTRGPRSVENTVNREAFREAVRNGQFQVMKFLWSYDPEYLSQVIPLAAYHGHFDTVLFALNHGAVNDRSLILASHNDWKIVKLLIDRGADPSVDNYESLSRAAAEGHWEIVRVLLENGSNNQQGKDRALILASGKDHLNILNLLLDWGANVHTQHDAALRKAVENNQVESARLLLDRGANVWVFDNSPMKTAVYKRYPEMIELLRSFGAPEATPPSEETTGMMNRLTEILQRFR
jgi:ankyrin repeat protein